MKNHATAFKNSVGVGDQKVTKRAKVKQEKLTFFFNFYF